MPFPFETLTYQEIKKLAERYPPLSERLQEQLAAIASAGDEEAKDLLFKHNAQRLLFFAEVFAPEGPGLRKGKKAPWRMRMMAKWRENAPSSITIDDIISAACEGLWRAIETYDPTRGKFNHHANVLIWQRIQALRPKAEKTEAHETPLDEGDFEAEHVLLDEEIPEPVEQEALATFNREAARMLFDWYAEKLLSDDERARLSRMLSGEEKPDKSFLAEIGKKLREGMPEGDWAFLAEWLTGR